MKLTRYITKYDYDRFINHKTTLSRLIFKSTHKDEQLLYDPLRPSRRCDYKISIEIKENK